MNTSANTPADAASLARNALFLQEMGIAVQWQRKLAPAVADPEAPAPTLVQPEPVQAEPPVTKAVQAEPAQAQVVPALMPPVAAKPTLAAGAGKAAANFTPVAKSAAPDRKAHAADVVPWAMDDLPPVFDDAYFSGSTPHWDDLDADQPPSRESLIAAMNWQQLQQAVATCTACNLCQGRAQTVFGNGTEKPAWVLVGDTPNQADEAGGKAFSGDAALLLDNMLRAIGRTQQVYATHLVKCRAKDEQGQPRPPKADEIAACRPFLQRQIELLQPRLVLALGKTAAQALRTEQGGTLRGIIHRAFGKPMVATWHPAILLQQPLEKRQVWTDLCLAKKADGA
jgi:DNA polymerase